MKVEAANNVEFPFSNDTDSQNLVKLEAGNTGEFSLEQSPEVWLPEYKPQVNLSIYFLQHKKKHLKLVQDFLFLFFFSEMYKYRGKRRR